jgi:hypothetical protein
MPKHLLGQEDSNTNWTDEQANWYDGDGLLMDDGTRWIIRCCNYS